VPQSHVVIYVLAYPIFEPSSAERISTFRAKHEPERAKLVPPHITLVFGVEDAHLQRVSHLLDKVSARTEAFQVVFEASVVEFDPFEKKQKLFLLCADRSGQIAALHEQLYEGDHRSELNSRHPFKPHMTIATYNERKDVEQLDVSAIGDFPIKAKLSALKMVQLSDGRLTTLKTVPLLL